MLMRGVRAESAVSCRRPFFLIACTENGVFVIDSVPNSESDSTGRPAPSTDRPRFPAQRAGVLGAPRTDDKSNRGAGANPRGRPGCRPTTRGTAHNAVVTTTSEGTGAPPIRAATQRG